MLEEGGRYGQLVTGLRPLVHHKNTTINLGLAWWGLNHPGNGEAVAFCGVQFFEIMAGRGVLRQHDNQSVCAGVRAWTAGGRRSGSASKREN